MNPLGFRFRSLHLTHVFICAVLLLSSFSIQGQSIKNLTMGPCNSHGIPYCGALVELEREGKLIYLERVAGEHGGAIPATLLALGYSANEVADIMRYTDFNQFEKETVTGVPSVFPIENREAFAFWIQSHISRRTGSANTTFEDLHKNRTRWKGFDLFLSSDVEGGILSYETTPDMTLADAVMHSYGTRHDFSTLGSEHDLNAVVSTFDSPQYYNELTLMAFDSEFRNPQTLGLKIVCAKQKKAPVEDTFFVREVEIVCTDLNAETPPAQTNEGKAKMLDQGSSSVLAFFSHSANE